MCRYVSVVYSREPRRIFHSDLLVDHFASPREARLVSSKIRLKFCATKLFDAHASFLPPSLT